MKKTKTNVDTPYWPPSRSGTYWPDNYTLVIPSPIPYIEKIYWNHCPMCGKKVTNEWVYCPDCGKQLHEELNYFWDST